MKLFKTPFSLLVFCLFTASALANNVTLSGLYDGTEPNMEADPNSCDNLAKRFREAGTITVSTTGNYSVVDAGNWFPYSAPEGQIADSVIIFYAGNFNSASPSTNRVASVDEFEDVELSAGTSYTVVVQHWCEEINGPYAIVIEGGQKTVSVSGNGFTSPQQTLGNFNSSSPTAYFADVNAVRRYRSDTKTVGVSGTYFYVDVGVETGGSEMILRIYKDSFDPLNTEANLVYTSEGFYIGSFSLKAGVNYVFVLVEYYEDSTHLQYVLYPPGPFNFNPGLNGAWVADNIAHQGILMEVLPSAGILFFAHFTFQDDLPVATSKAAGSTVQSSGGGGSGTEAHIGSDDQVWLTAFGSIPATGNMMTISYENSTGGRFNSETPVATTNSSYGSGYIQGITCDHLVFNWNLPGGVVDTRDYYKATQDAVPYCESFISAGPVSSNW